MLPIEYIVKYRFLCFNAWSIGYKEFTLDRVRHIKNSSFSFCSPESKNVMALNALRNINLNFVSGS